MIGERLQELRKDRGYSQQELADLLGVSHFTISSYECNRSDPDEALKVKIAEIFDISIDYLLGLVKEPFSYKRDRKCLYLPDGLDGEDMAAARLYVEFLRFKKAAAK